jgi:2-oxoglutarate dehydrogenase E2 component (dihydrolipoamide succinyltransferase)
VLKACALSLQEYPELNARLEGDEIVYLERYDIGVAVQTDQGLVVPSSAAASPARSTSSPPTSTGSRRRLAPGNSHPRSCGARPSR